MTPVPFVVAEVMDKEPLYHLCRVVRRGWAVGQLGRARDSSGIEVLLHPMECCNGARGRWPDSWTLDAPPPSKAQA